MATFSFNTSLSSDQQHSIIQHRVDEYNANKISYSGSIFGDYGGGASGTSSRSNNFFDNLWEGMKASFCTEAGAMISAGFRGLMTSMFTRAAGGTSGAGGTGGADSTGGASGTRQYTTAQLHEQLNYNNTRLSEMNDTIADLTRKIADANNEDAQAQLDAELETLVGKDDNRTTEQQKAFDIIKTQNKLETANANLRDTQSTIRTCNQNINSLKGVINTYETQINQLSTAPAADEAEQARFDSRRSELEGQKQAKDAELRQEEANLKAAQDDERKYQEEIRELQTELNKYQNDDDTKQVFSDVSAYRNRANNHKTNVNNKAKMEADLNTITEQRDQLRQETAQLQALYDQQLMEDAQARTQTRGAVEQYVDADSKDGKNWWKRNMPSWLGGSNKATRAVYRAEHQRKKDAAQTLGGSNRSARQAVTNMQGQAQYQNYSGYHKRDASGARQNITQQEFLAIYNTLGYNPSDSEIKKALQNAGFTT